MLQGQIGLKIHLMLRCNGYRKTLSKQMAMLRKKIRWRQLTILDAQAKRKDLKKLQTETMKLIAQECSMKNKIMISCLWMMRKPRH